MKAYLKNYGHVEPHIYSVSESAVQNLGISGNQTIIVSGESGAGKTINARHLLEYLVWRNKGTEKLQKLLLESHLILESFGNAKTQINSNSSRFGKFLTLNFDGDRVIGGKIAGYLLEKSRVTHQTDGNRNFHVFYMICASERLNITNDYIDCRWTASDLQRCKMLERAFEELGLGSFEGIKTLLLAVLHMGSLRFADENGCTKLQGGKSLDFVCSALGVKKEDLERILLKGCFVYKTEYLETLNSVEKARVIRDTLARNIYSRVFQHVIDLLNKNMECNSGSRSISILDIYGFEAFERNSFDQFCINWANERIQNEFVRRMFFDRQEFYRKQGIEWPEVEFPTNDAVLRLIEKKCGLADLIEEESLNPCGNVESLLVKMHRHNRDELHFESTKARNTIKISHFAHPVEYCIDDFLEKNTEGGQVLPIGDLGLSLGSTCMGVPDTEGRRRSFIRYFKDSMDYLFSEINRTEIHYVRCIRPNEDGRPWCFDADYVRRQIKSCGVVETIRLSQLTYPHIIPIQKFVERYGLVNIGAEDQKDYKVGRNFYFVKKNLLRELEGRRSTLLQRCRMHIYQGMMSAVFRRTIASLKMLMEEKLHAFREEGVSQSDLQSGKPFWTRGSEAGQKDSTHSGEPFEGEEGAREGERNAPRTAKEAASTSHALETVEGKGCTPSDLVNSCEINMKNVFTEEDENTADTQSRTPGRHTVCEPPSREYAAQVPSGGGGPCENCRIIETKYRYQSEALKRKKKLESELESMHLLVKKYESEVALYKELVKDMTISANQIRIEDQSLYSSSSEKTLHVNFSNPHDIFGCLIDVYIEYSPTFTEKHIPKDEMLSFAHVSYKAITELAVRAQCSEFLYMEILVHEITEKVQQFGQNAYKVAFMVSNLLELKRLLRRIDAEKSLEELDTLSGMLFEHFCELEREAMAGMLPDSVIYYQAMDAFKCENSFYKRFFAKTPSILKLVNYLDYICSMMVYFVFPDTHIRESLRYILRSINSTCFNRVLVEKNFLSFNRSTQINFNLNEIQKFCQEIGFMEGIFELQHIQDIIRLVNLAKNGNSASVILQECASINQSQLVMLATKLEGLHVEMDIGDKMEDSVLFLPEPKVLAPPCEGECTNFTFCIPRYVPSKYITAILSSI
ncbi:UNVERIFIED_CONTAM: hypothetical protein PYX00_010883 [Menopon gallinae]|uniref:Myosin heavy chain n=1 Tax=Menopon gallinae TaxID=328185 RepID=A0AAW2H6F1_9NEOP